MMTVRPEEHKDEILRLYTQEDRSQAEIMRYFQQRGLELKRSTLSDFLQPYIKGSVKAHEDEDRALGPALAYDGGEVSEQFRALTDFYKATAEEVIDQLLLVSEGLEQVRQESDSRHAAVQGKLDAALARLRGEVPASVLRRIFGRGMLLGMLVVGLPVTVSLLVNPLTLPGWAFWIRGIATLVWKAITGLFG
jgi:Clr5-like protein